MRRLSVMSLATLVRRNVRGQLSPNERGSEAGAIAAIVGIFLGGGVLLGVGALVIDTGSLLYERRQLQSGADAVAMSIAQACAKAPTSTDCTDPFKLALPLTTLTSVDLTLVNLAGENAADGKSDITRVCASKALYESDTSTFPDECTDWPATPTAPDPGLVECPRTSSTGKYVEVTTSTNTGNSTILPPILAQTLAGGYSGETVKACARAAWGAARLGNVLPTTFSACEWNAATTDGSSYPAKPFTAATTAFERRLLLSDSAVTDPACSTWLGHDLPGGFGWVTTSTNCVASVSDLSWIDVKTGTAVVDNSCKTIIRADLYKIVYIPIFDCLDPVGGYVVDDTKAADGTTLLHPCLNNPVTGTHAQYHVKGFGAFYLTGWKLGGMADQAPLNPANACSGGQTCLYGWFTQDLQLAGEFDFGSEDMGLRFAKFLG
jgi:Putative Flp pilus-assembly TadE/G-like